MGMDKTMTADELYMALRRAEADAKHARYRVEHPSLDCPVSRDAREAAALRMESEMRDAADASDRVELDPATYASMRAAAEWARAREAA